MWEKSQRSDEEFMIPKKEISKYWLRFNNAELEAEYFEKSVDKYQQLGYTICLIHSIIIISDFIRLFQENTYPSKKLIYQVIMLAIAVVIFIILYFKKHLFNRAYFLYYFLYISMNGWYMYDPDLNEDTDSNESNDTFTRGYTLSAILTLGITGSNYILKNILFLYGTILIYVAQAIQVGSQVQIIVRVILVQVLYFYVSHHREHEHRLSYLRQKQIDQYNNIINNQIPHCLFAAKFNSAEQRIELFKCNSRAQKEFGINGNEDFDRFITNTFLISSEKNDGNVQPINSIQPSLFRSRQCTWENSLKGKIRQLIDQSIRENNEEDEIQDYNPHQHESNIPQQFLKTKDQQMSQNFPQKQKSLKNSAHQQQSQQLFKSPFFKLKLQMQEGVDGDHKISVQLSLFKLHEYYIIITVDKWNKKKLKDSFRNGSEAQILSSKKYDDHHLLTQQTPGAYFLNNDQKIQHHSKQSNIFQYPIIEAQNDNNDEQQVLSDAHRTAEENESNQMKQNTLSPKLAAQILFSQKQNPQKISNFLEEGEQHNHTPFQQSRISASSFGAGVERGYQQFQTNPPHIQGIIQQNSFHLQTPPKNSSSASPSISKILLANKAPLALINTTTPINSNNNITSNNHNHFNAILQKKISFSTMRKPVCSIQSTASTTVPSNFSHANQTRTTATMTSFGQDYYLQNKRISQISHSKYHFPNTPSHSTQVIAPTEDKQLTDQNSFKKTSSDQNIIQSQNSKGKSIKETMYNSCFQVINETISLIKRYKNNWKQFRDLQINTALLQKGEEPLEQYTRSLQQQIMIVNSNFIKLNALSFNQTYLQLAIFELQSIIDYLKYHLQPLILDRNISLYLQDDFQCTMHTDEYALRIVLINIVSYISDYLVPSNGYIAVKCSMIQDYKLLKVQISYPQYEIISSSSIEKLLLLDPDKNLFKDNNEFNVNLRVAMSLLKKMNNDNTQIKDYLKILSSSNSFTQNNLLIFTLPLDISQSEAFSTPNNVFNENHNCTTNPNADLPPLKSTERQLKPNEKQYKLIENNSKQESENSNNEIQENRDKHESYFKKHQKIEINDSNIVTVPANIEEDELNNEEDSLASLDRWITLKQYLNHAQSKKIKLIL